MFEVGKMYRMKTGGFRMVYHEASNVADLLPGAIEDTSPAPVETLRDRFAMAALTGRMARNSDYASWADAAADAYECADAMLAEREKPHGR